MNYIDLHHLAVDCLNAVLAIEHLGFCIDGFKHARGHLLKLETTIAKMPALPFFDPFSGDNLVEVDGVIGTSAHAAAFALARRAWQAVQLHALVPDNAFTTEQGTTVVTSKVLRSAPTAVPWSESVWQSVREQLAQALTRTRDRDWWENALALELNRATNQQASKSQARCGVRHQKRQNQRTCQSGKPNFAQWGIGFDPTTGWHVFRLTGQGWSYAKKKLKVSKGIQHYLFDCLLTEKGTLKRASILKFFDRTRTRPKKFDCYLSRLRAAILNGIGYPNSPLNPLAKTKGDSSWQLLIKIGQAEKCDPEFIRGDPGFSFQPCD